MSGIPDQIKCIQRIEQYDYVYLLPNIFKRWHVFFAIDNVDSPKKDASVDGKFTFHGTAMAIYQREDQVVHVPCRPNSARPFNKRSARFHYQPRGMPRH